MAEIYAHIGRHKIEKFIAILPDVQAELQRQAEVVAARAEANLAQVRADPDYTGEGHSRITVTRGRVDRFVNLDDERGDQAAAAIEFGREAYTYRTKDGRTVHVRATEGKYVLTDAANLPFRKRG